MNVVFMASIVILLTVVFGIVLAAVVGWFGRLVKSQDAAAKSERERFNAAATLGLEIPVDADTAEQLQAARKIAAKNAASLPRWGNMSVGQMGPKDQATAHDGVKNDPVSAVKIASFHGWAGVASGFTSSEQVPAQAVRATAQTTVATKSVADLVPGEDYEFIELTDDLSPAEKRKARIANSKARSAAIKALKASGGVAVAAQTVAAEGQPAAADGPAQAAQPAVTAAAPAAEPVAGIDYAVIEITEDMDPAEIRKTRIANSKAKSAALKAYKEAGGGSAVPAAAAADPSPVGATVEQTMAAVDEKAAVPVIPSDIPKPDYMAITEDMDPADIRNARIHNSKAKSAYNKALKAAGIDPSTVSD